MEDTEKASCFAAFDKLPSTSSGQAGQAEETFCFAAFDATQNKAEGEGGSVSWRLFLKSRRRHCEGEYLGVGWCFNF